MVKGVIQFSTKEYFENDKLYFEVCIANSNSYIEEEYKEKVFDLFFYKKEKTWDGIGLELLKKLLCSMG